jgi:plastocyanin
MKTKFTLLLFLAISSFSVAFATNHIITFGNYFYSPAATSVAVGDTITWQGDFPNHPLSTTAIPSGALAINHVDIGTSYSYVVLVPGTYSYRCDLHFSMGMFGSFSATAITAAVDDVSRPALSFKVSTFGNVIKLDDKNEKRGTYEIRIGNILGEPVWSGIMKSDEREKIIDIEEQPAGVYLLVVADEHRQAFVRKFLIH